jgi:hypothetical protein
LAALLDQPFQLACITQGRPVRQLFAPKRVMAYDEGLAARVREVLAA